MLDFWKKLQIILKNEFWYLAIYHVLRLIFELNMHDYENQRAGEFLGISNLCFSQESKLKPNLKKDFSFNRLKQVVNRIWFISSQYEHGDDCW